MKIEMPTAHTLPPLEEWADKARATVLARLVRRLLEMAAEVDHTPLAPAQREVMERHVLRCVEIAQRLAREAPASAWRRWRDRDARSILEDGLYGRL